MSCGCQQFPWDIWLFIARSTKLVPLLFFLYFNLCFSNLRDLFLKVNLMVMCSQCHNNWGQIYWFKHKPTGPDIQKAPNYFPISLFLNYVLVKTKQAFTYTCNNSNSNSASTKSSTFTFPFMYVFSSKKPNYSISNMPITFYFFYFFFRNNLIFYFL